MDGNFKEHQHDYPMDRPKGEEVAFTAGKPLTFVVTAVYPNYIKYRLYSSSNPKQYHWWYVSGSPLKPSDFVVGEATGVNTIALNGKYIWLSKYKLLDGFDKYQALKEVNEDTLLDLLSSNQFKCATEIYQALCTDFKREKMSPLHKLFVEDYEDICDLWIERDDSRQFFLMKWVEPVRFEWTGFDPNEVVDLSAYETDLSDLFGEAPF